MLEIATKCLAALVCLAACACVASCSEPTAKLWLGGDVHLGDGGVQLLSGLRPAIKGRLGFVNLEGPVRASMPLGEGVRLHNAPSALSALTDVGVNWVGIANNHALDAGVSAFTETSRQLKTAGLHPVGGPAGAALSVINGLKVAWTAHDIATTATATIAADVAAASETSDAAIASLHSVGPPSYLPDSAVTAAVAAAVAAGARVVVVHGSHALARVERRGEAVLFWGLGNMLFNCDCTREHEGLLATVTLRAKGPPKVEIIPIWAGLGGQPARIHRDSAGVLDLLEGLGTALKGRRDGRGWL